MRSTIGTRGGARRPTSNGDKDHGSRSQFAGFDQRLCLLVLLLIAQATCAPVLAQQRSPRKAQIPKNAVQLSHVDNSAEGKKSLGGSGHAVQFERPANAKSLVAVEIFGSRYGHPQPPQEDFHVYLLDEKQKILKDLPYPYATVERGQERWYTLPVPRVPVPERFFVALCFNPEQTKGVYLGFDENVKESHSYTGLPNRGFRAFSDGDWMVRVYLAPGGGAGTGSGGFSAVVELELPAAGTSFIDLEAGEVVPVPPEMQGNTDREKWMAWSAENSVDLSVRAAGENCYLGYIDACLLSTSNTRWESLSAALLARNRALEEGEPGLGNFQHKKDEMPVTYLFKTREGSLGLVQLVGFGEKHQSVKIRFKRME